MEIVFVCSYNTTNLRIKVLSNDKNVFSRLSFFFKTQHRWLKASHPDEGIWLQTQDRRKTKDKANSISVLVYLS